MQACKLGAVGCCPPCAKIKTAKISAGGSKRPRANPRKYTPVKISRYTVFVASSSVRGGYARTPINARASLKENCRIFTRKFRCCLRQSAAKNVTTFMVTYSDNRGTHHVINGAGTFLLHCSSLTLRKCTNACARGTMQACTVALS